MSVEGFVRAAGGVMGQARDGFGTGVGVLLPLPPLAPAPPPAITPGQGQAADGQQDSASQHHNSTAALSSLDDTSRAELDAATASASVRPDTFGSQPTRVVGRNEEQCWEL